MTILFWLSFALLVYVYAGFALLLVIVGRIRYLKVRKQPLTPSISIIIAAYNEEQGIAAKLENVLALDYPSGALEIIVASDGCDDATEAIVSKFAGRGVRLLCLPRRGKIYALKDAVTSASGDILVFSDATSILENYSLRALAANFADPNVGGVGGSMVYRRQTDSDSSSHGENLYWTYEVWLKQMESLTGSIISASGALFAIRRELYQPPLDAGVTDDFIISTAVIEKGYRLVFEPQALVYEQPAVSASGEFARKVRMMTRGLRAVLVRKKLLNPFRYGFYSLALFSHKVLRRLIPFFLISLFASSFILRSSDPVYTVAFVGQILFYFMASAGYLARSSEIGRVKMLYIPFFYCLANAAALTAVINVVSGKRIELWQPQR